jgi:hypothetical protein
MLLKTTFVELRVVAGRSRTRLGRSHAVSGRPMLIHTSCHAHAAPIPRCAVAVRTCFQNGHGRGMTRARHGMCETRPHCVNQMGKTQPIPLAARHGMGTAWE